MWRFLTSTVGCYVSLTAFLTEKEMFSIVDMFAHWASPSLRSNVKFVHALAREIRATVDELNEPTKTEFLEIEEAIGGTEQPLGRSGLTVFAFNLFANTTWGIGYEIKAPVTSVHGSDDRIKGFIDSL